jgi:hypothetical protein
MRFASFTPFCLMMVAALGGVAACSGDDDDDVNSGGSAGTAGTGHSGGTDSGEGGGAPLGEDSQLCTDLGGPRNIDAVVRGDGETASEDPFNGFKFEKDGRQASVLLNAATDPCIGQQFAHLLAPAKAAALEHFAQCLSLFVQHAAGCAVAYDHDTAGKACLSMAAAHAGLGITEEDYTALIGDAATALIAAGVDPQSEQFAAVAGALTADSLKDDVIGSDSADYSRPGEMCGADGVAGDGAGGSGAGGEPSASGEAGMGGTP